jgi:hypothetical protein
MGELSMPQVDGRFAIARGGYSCAPGREGAGCLFMTEARSDLAEAWTLL